MLPFVDIHTVDCSLTVCVCVCVCVCFRRNVEIGSEGARDGDAGTAAGTAAATAERGGTARQARSLCQVCLKTACVCFFHITNPPCFHPISYIIYVCTATCTCTHRAVPVSTLK